MAKHKIITTDAEIDRAIEQARGVGDEPRVVKVEYRPGPGLDLLILTMRDGRRHVIPREDLQGLQRAGKEQIAGVEIVGNGTGLHWEALGVDHYVPSLLRRIYGNRSWMAQIGRKGGSATSLAKKKASRINGLKGGRPSLDANTLDKLQEAANDVRRKFLERGAQRAKTSTDRTA